MTLEYIRLIFDYNQWANDRTLEAVATLDDEQFRRDLDSSFSSIRDTLVHVLSSEWVWLSRWKGRSPSGFPEAADLRTIGAVRERWSDVEAEVSDFISELTPDRLASDISYSNTKGQPFIQPLWQQMCHVVNHSSYHRGQVATMMRQLGEVPVGTDMIAYFRR